MTEHDTLVEQLAKTLFDIYQKYVVETDRREQYYPRLPEQWDDWKDGPDGLQFREMARTALRVVEETGGYGPMSHTVPDIVTTEPQRSFIPARNPDDVARIAELECSLEHLAKVADSRYLKVRELERRLQEETDEHLAAITESGTKRRDAEAKVQELERENERLLLQFRAFDSAEKYERERAEKAGQRLTDLQAGLDILVRACEAGAYVGRTSPAVVQARTLLEGKP